MATGDISQNRKLPILSVTVTGTSPDKMLIINIRYQWGELAGLVSLGDKHADQFIRVDLTIFCHFHDAEYILNLLVGELLTEGLEHGLELFRINGSWGNLQRIGMLQQQHRHHPVHQMTWMRTCSGESKTDGCTSICGHLCPIFISSSTTQFSAGSGNVSLGDETILILVHNKETFLKLSNLLAAEFIKDA